MTNNKKKNIIEEELESDKEELESTNNIEEFEEEFEEVSLEDRILSIEKKTNATFILLIIVMLMVLISLVYMVSNHTDANTPTNNQTTGESSTTYDTSAMTEIKAADIATLSKNTTIVVMVGRQGCGWCAEYAPMYLTLANEYQVTPYYIDLAKILDFSQYETTGQVPIADQSAYETMTSLSGSGEWATFVKENFGGTPLTIIIKDNKVVGGLGGYPRNGITDARSAYESAGLKK